MEDLLVLVDENDKELGVGPKLEVHQKKLLHRAFSIFLYDRETDSMLLQQRAYGKYHSGGLWSNTCCSHPRAGESFREALVRRLNQELGLQIPEADAEIQNASLQEDSLLFPPFENTLVKTDPIPENTAVYDSSAANTATGSDPFFKKKASGLSFTFIYCGRFLYLADYGVLAEHEIDRVFFLPVDRKILGEKHLLKPDPEEIAGLQWMSRENIRRKLVGEPEYFSAWFERAFSLADRVLDSQSVLFSLICC